MRRLQVTWMLVLVIGCGPRQAEYDAALAELEKCQTYVAELEDLPTNRLARARQLESDGKETEAEAVFADLIERYPDSEEAQIAEQATAAIGQRREEARQEEERKRQEEERKKRLGFKVLAAQSRVESGDVVLRVHSVQARKQWVSDRYESRYHYRDATRGSKYIVADFSISSEAHNPTLLPIYVYDVSGDRLSLLGIGRYEFHRWDDYGSYLGNTADYRNDFAHTKTIRFSAGLEVSDEALKEPIFVLVGKRPCVQRTSERLSNPPIRYESSGCSRPSGLTLSQVEQGYEVIKVFNKSAL